MSGDRPTSEIWIAVDVVAVCVIQAPELQPGIMRYESGDDERYGISAMLPNRPRGIPSVDDRRALNGIVRVLRSGGSAAAGVLWMPGANR